MNIEQKSVGEVAIRFLSGPLVEKTISIQKPVTIIGRDPQSDIVVFDPRVSRQHACIRMENGTWSIENLSQSSFITINQQQIQHGILQHTNVVGLGENTSFVFLVQRPMIQTVPSSNFTVPEMGHPIWLATWPGKAGNQARSARNGKEGLPRFLGRSPLHPARSAGCSRSIGKVLRGSAVREPACSSQPAPAPWWRRFRPRR